MTHINPVQSFLSKETWQQFFTRNYKSDDSYAVMEKVLVKGHQNVMHFVCYSAFLDQAHS